MESSDLKKAGLKITLPRMKILEFLEASNTRHQSAEDIYRALRDDDHIVCVSCGKVEEFYDELIESRQKEVALDKGYEVTDHSLILYGKCPICQKK